MSAAPTRCPRRRMRLGASAATVSLDADPRRASSANPTSRADWKRSSGSFSRQRRTTASKPVGTGPAGELIGGGSEFRMAERVSTVVAPRKARRPASISYRIAPNANTSERASARPSRTCSGET